MPETNTPILNDLPTDVDTLDFMPYARALSNICQTAATPLTIGIFGSWGSGKTSLMQMIKKDLPAAYTVAWFGAWKYEDQHILWRAFLLSILFAVEAKQGKETDELKALKTLLYRDLEIEKIGGVTIDLAQLGAKVARGAVQIGFSFIPPLAKLTEFVKELQKNAAKNTFQDSMEALRQERTKLQIDQVRSLEQFHEKFRILIENYILPNRMVIFIDDLDRCLPE